jgi:hypothetical protein
MSCCELHGAPIFKEFSYEIGSHFNERNFKNITEWDVSTLERSA